MRKAVIAVVVLIVILAGAAYWLTNMNKSNNNTTNTPAPTNMETDKDMDGDEVTPTDESNSQTQKTNEVTIQNFAFSPANITVKKGTKVTWTNQDSVGHTVTADSGDGPNSQLLNQGQSYTFTFDTVGTFKYHCQPHPKMTGTVVVE
jgi:plastocyanin